MSIHNDWTALNEPLPIWGENSAKTRLGFASLPKKTPIEETHPFLSSYKSLMAEEEAD